MAKIKSIKILNDGASESLATEIWVQTEKFAGYGFNKSHSVAYTMLSYIGMWLKVYYPAEFFCGFLTHAKTEKRDSALYDMKRMGVKMLTPDINESTDRFEALHANAILAPFDALRGVGRSTCQAILTARATGKFISKADLEARVEKRHCNVRHRDLLDRVGAFARIDPTALPIDHPDRRRDQIDLMQGLIIDAVKVERTIDLDKFKVEQLGDLIEGYRKCEKCELAGLCHPKPFAKGPPLMMVIIDGPSYHDEAADEIGAGRYMDALSEALGKAGLRFADIYLTSLIKSPKPERTKAWANTTLVECPTWLNQEIDLLKPPLIITLGSLSMRHFKPELKGSPDEHVGRVIYDRARDANILIGINPATIYFTPSKQTVLNEVFARAISLLDV